MMALLFATAPSTEIIITGSPEGGQTKAMIQRINRYYLPHRLVVLHPGGDTGKELGRLVPMIKRLPPPEDNKSIAYLCSNFTCREPITDHWLTPVKYGTPTVIIKAGYHNRLF